MLAWTAAMNGGWGRARCAGRHCDEDEKSPRSLDCFRPKLRSTGSKCHARKKETSKIKKQAASRREKTDSQCPHLATRISQFFSNYLIALEFSLSFKGDNVSLDNDVE